MQKKIAVINDISGFGRCSVAVCQGCEFLHLLTQFFCIGGVQLPVIAHDRACDGAGAFRPGAGAGRHHRDQTGRVYCHIS